MIKQEAKLPNLLEYESFKQKFDFIYLQGLKGMERACQIYQKNTNKILDYIEVEFKDVSKFDEFAEFCEFLLMQKSDSVLQLLYYSRIFAVESLGNPYCKYFLIFEYCESSVQNEMQHLQKSGKNFSKQTVQQIFLVIAKALSNFHNNLKRKMIHGDLRTCKIMKNEKGYYKLLPPRIQTRMKGDKYYWSPEEYQAYNFRSATEKSSIDLFKAEIFTLGLLMLHIGTFVDFSLSYQKFNVSDVLILNTQENFRKLYGAQLASVVDQCLNWDFRKRPSASDVVNLLLNPPPIDAEKENDVQGALAGGESSPAKGNGYEQQLEKMGSAISGGVAGGNTHKSQFSKTSAVHRQSKSHYVQENDDSNNSQPQSQSQQEKAEQEDSDYQHNKSPKNVRIEDIKHMIKKESSLQSNISDTSDEIDESNKQRLEQNKNSQCSNDQQSPTTQKKNEESTSKAKKGKTQKILRYDTKAIGSFCILANNANKWYKGSAKSFGQALKQIERQKKRITFQDDNEQNYDSKIFSKLPQEYQDEIDVNVESHLSNLENTCPIEFLPHGYRYQGERNSKGEMEGWGTYWWANGELYEGQFQKNKYHGIGIYYWPTGEKYFGEFQNGNMQGIGAKFLENGIYYGQWDKGKSHGKGTYYWNNGAKFRGTFLYDKIYGKGVLIMPGEMYDEERRYEGLWKDENGTGISVEQFTFDNNNNQNKQHSHIQNANQKQQSQTCFTQKPWKVTNKIRISKPKRK